MLEIASGSIDPWTRAQPVWLVVPTYNERENIPRLLAAVERWPLTVLIVDDNSPDGTGELAEALQTHQPRLRVLRRPRKEGLAVAYAAGLRNALDGGAQAIIHMDADLSHPVECIPSLVAALASADLVIGSRYVRGGQMILDWPRRLISLIGNAYIRAILGRGIRDWSSGFKAWRAETLRRVLSRPLTTRGFACLMEMTWRAIDGGARVTEIPIRFVDRTAGRSKFNWAIAKEDIATAWRLRRGG